MKGFRYIPMTAALLVAATLVSSGQDSADSKRQMTKEEVEKLFQSVSNWGRWGKTDELGTLNLITPEKRKQAAQLVRDGVSVSMAKNALKGSVKERRFSHTIVSHGSDRDWSTCSDEFRVRFHGFAHTHVDAVCHYFYKGKMYNGFSRSELTDAGSNRLSVIQMKNGVFTKAVLMDFPHLFGKEYLDGSRAIYPEDLDAWEKKAGVKVESGDAVLIHTGRWARQKANGRWDFGRDSAGLHASCLTWLKERDVAIVGSDLALDVMPSGVEGYALPVHVGVLVLMGMPILDCLDFGAVSREARERNRWAFLLSVGPLAVEGATGSPINPIATF